MLPLVVQLSRRLADRERPTASRNLAPVEAIASAFRLEIDLHQVPVERRQRCSGLLESEELGMVAVAPGPPAEHRPGEQSFTPDGDQSGGVEVAGMQGPESHGSERVSGLLDQPNQVQQGYGADH